MTTSQWGWVVFAAALLILIIALKQKNKPGTILGAAGMVVGLIIAAPGVVRRAGPFLKLQGEAWPALFAHTQPSGNPVPWVIAVLAALAAVALGLTKKLSLMAVAIVVALVALFFALPGLMDGFGPFLNLQGESWSQLFK